MLDLFYVISTGGKIIFRRSFEESDRNAKRVKELSEFIREAFLSQKPEGNRQIRMGKSIYTYIYDRERSLIFVCLFSEEFNDWNFDEFLAEFVKNYSHPSSNEKISQVLERQLTNFKFGPKVQKKEESIQKSITKSASKPQEPPKVKKPGKGLDFSKNSEISDSKGQDYFSKTNPNDEEFKELSESESEDVVPEKPSWLSKLKSSISTIKDGRPINETIKPILEEFKQSLITKNVGEEVARKICLTIEDQMIAKKASLFSSTKKIVKEALKTVLTQILTPKTYIDLLSLGLKKREEGSPLVLTFVGVNGVGKSTNLAKVAYHFKNNGFSVLLAACDTFRAGAVEQIKTHGKYLEIPVFDRAYKDDPANIARDAINEAKAKRIEVVLIDTAGRMQDNEPLMKALARLVNLNYPDVVVFIGEALAGNDVIDQLTKFNASLKNFSSSSEKDGREIDGIILSKFDTVDEKVGAALNLTYITGKPILFIGTGQKYPDLKRLNVDEVVHSLLK